MKVAIVCCFSIFCAVGANLGGWKELDVNDPKVEALSNACIQELDAKSNSLYQNKLFRVKSAKVQLVAGWQYSLVFQMGQTSCIKTKEPKNLEECNVENNLKECHVVLWIQPWMKTQTIKSSKCIPIKGMFQTQDTLKKGWTGMEEKILDQTNKQKVDDLTVMNQKFILGGDDHDVGNYGEFELFKTKYNKVYANRKEEVKRFTIFHQNMQMVKKLQFYEKGYATYGATEFADMSVEEFRKTHLTPKWNLKYDKDAKIAHIPTGTPPNNWDWRDHGVVSAVKNQGSCGSCWAFSTTGNVEGQWAIKKKQLVSLSEQELVDCDKVDEGCNGGLPIDAYKAIMKLGGLETEKEYPYKGSDDKCTFNKTEAKVDINGYLNISSNEDDMAAWLQKNGPISIGINAMAMQFYMGGIAHPWSIFCNPQSLDHGVLIVGYGIKKSGLIFKKDTPFWIIKNSWGPGWGEKGYYLLYRGDGVCGVNQMPTSATVH